MTSAIENKSPTHASRALDSNSHGDYRAATQMNSTSPSEIVNLPGISSEAIAAANIRHVNADEAFELCGLREPGLWIPYFNLDGSPVLDGGKIYGRLRMNTPKGSKKYHQAHGTTQHGYVPKSIADMPMGADLHVVEGEKKALSLCDAGHWAVGIGGFYGFASKCEDGFAFLSELQAVFDAKKPARIFFVGDTDTALNFEFSRAALRFASMAPCPVLLPRIPLSSPKGCDDCRAAMGDAFGEFWSLTLNSAAPVDPKIAVESLALRLLEWEVSSIIDSTGDHRDMYVQKIIAMGAASNNPLYVDSIIKVGAKLDFSKAAFREAIKQKSKEHKQTCTGDADVIDQYGLPLFSDDKKPVPTLNEAYWSGYYRKQHTVLFEPDELDFYRYDDKTGLWEIRSSNAIGTDLDAILMEESKLCPSLSNFRGARYIRDIISKLKGQAERRNAFVKAFNYVHLKNCILVFNGESVTGVEFSPEYFSRNASPITYNRDAVCPKFSAFLSESLPQEDILLFQEYFGLALLGVNLPQVIMLIYGVGKTGKSQLASVVRLIVGELNCAELRTKLLDERFETNRYKRKTLLLGGDVRGDFLSTSPAQRLKALTGGDLIESEAKGQNGGTNIRGTFNVLITSNERLRVRLEGEADISAWKRRLIILEFKSKPVEKRIPNFGEYLVQQEGSGILNFALEGLQRYFARGGAELPLTAEQSARVDRLLRESESLRHFVEECVVKQSGADITSYELVEGYAQWSAANGFSPMPITLIEKILPGLMLERHHITKSNCIVRDGKSARGYFGVRLEGAQ